jgi:hypothetical protein
MTKRLSRWLGKLLSPAEDPYRGVAASSSELSDSETLLDELRRSRSELAQLLTDIQARSPESALARELAQQEQALRDAEHNLRASLDERRAQAVLREARRKAAEAELLGEF